MEGRSFSFSCRVPSFFFFFDFVLGFGLRFSIRTFGVDFGRDFVFFSANVLGSRNERR